MYAVEQLSGELSQLDILAIGDLTAELTSQDVDPDILRDNLMAICANRDQMLNIVREAGRIVGMHLLTVKITPHERTVYGDSMVVDPRYRTRGIGRALMQRANDFADELGLVHQGTVSPRRSVALELYESLGFQVWDTNFIVRPPAIET